MIEIIDGYCTPGTERETRMSAQVLLECMAHAGIRRAVIAPEDREIAVDNTRGNDRILGLAEQYPDSFIPACTANPWYGSAACVELRRVVNAGVCMLVLAPALQGFNLGDEVADDLLQTAGELGLPIYVHTGPHSASAPSQLLLVAARHSSTRFIMGHCGSTDYAADMMAVVRGSPRNLWFELSLARPWAAASYVHSETRGRVLFGSGAPRNDPAFELGQLEKYLPLSDHPDVYGANLLRLTRRAGR